MRGLIRSLLDTGLRRGNTDTLGSTAFRHVKETMMDFIESLFGVSPDGGDGSLEMLWVGAIVVAVVAVAFRRRIMTRLATRAAKKH
jgi:high-affinity Fe2+/Pb2+ permease